ncbi:hypothetical protein BCR42DRAFT_494982 [Absidia repens]|uniref:CUE domain-containing protein n=1 Tax=Absidia repens TaxID=90262 RepID=A0A1X2I545_9FUNG|nr:hypothetical protein BCR42DRAFT_494982 [Absidia repens]
MAPCIPYIPKHTSGVTEEIWNKAYNIWISQLTDLLEREDSSFLTQIDTDIDLQVWIQSLLQSQLDQGNTDPQLLRLVFLIYVRLGNVISHSGNGSSSPLISITALDTFSLAFARTNPVVVRELFSQLFSKQTKLLDQYETTVEQLIDTLESMDGYIANLQASFNGSSADGENWKQVCLERILVVARLLETKVVCLNAHFPRLFSVLVTCYDQLVDKFASTINDNNDTTGKVGYWVYLVKQALVNILQSTVEIKYLAPLGYVTVDQSGQLQKINNVNDGETIVMALHEQIIEWVEQSGLDSHKTVFVDAPLIMDWQVDWQVSKILDRINQDKFHGENEQLSFLVLVLEAQVQDLAQGIQQSWGHRIKQQNDEQVEQRLNSIKSTNNDNNFAATPASDDIQRASLISQVRDIFSDLGEGFVEACLIANNDDAEIVIMQLLENSLPPSVASLDRAMPRTTSLPSAPQPSLLDSRKNIFDKDEFDVFSGKIVQQTNTYVGKKNHGTTESLLESKKHTKDEKANMLRRIYDMYEDEIDDSYDSVNEMAGPVDLAAVDEGGQALDVVRAKKEQGVDPGVLNESELVHMYVDHPQVFDRSSAIRKSTQRDALKKRTNMTDEQLEGWAIMFNRNPRKQRILDKYMLFDGSQDQVSTDVKVKQQQQKEASSKPAPPSETKQRSYKDKNKARFGNHNRKRNHDKKLNKLAGPAGAP